MTSPRTVVITGLGATTSLGGDLPTTWTALLEGRSGIRHSDLGTPGGQPLPVRLAAPVAADPATRLSPAQLARNDRSSQLALIATQEAWRDAGLPAPGSAGASPPPERVAAVLGVGIGSVLSLTAHYDALLDKGHDGVPPRSIPMILPNHAAAQVGLFLRARSRVQVLSSACASGAEALAHGLTLIRTGMADVVLAGGTEAAIHPLIVAGFVRMGALSRRNDEPDRACRPFDLERDGFVMAEGAAMAVLESAEHATMRGARAYCELAGAGITNDSHHIAQPDPRSTGAAAAITAALADSAIRPSGLGLVKAHATSTPLGDRAEAQALIRALGAHAAEIPVFAPKAGLGHALGAAGSIETAVTALALHHRLVPPTRNLDHPDPMIGLDVVTGSPRPLPPRPTAALCNSFGFGGHNVALVLRTLPGPPGSAT